MLRGICLQLKRHRKKKGKIAANSGEIGVIQKYRKRIGVIEEGKKTLQIGKGIYTQAKRNAYKINPESGTYGNLTLMFLNYMVSFD